MRPGLDVLAAAVVDRDAPVGEQARAEPLLGPLEAVHERAAGRRRGSGAASATARSAMAVSPVTASTGADPCFFARASARARASSSPRDAGTDPSWSCARRMPSSSAQSTCSRLAVARSCRANASVRRRDGGVGSGSTPWSQTVAADVSGLSTSSWFTRCLRGSGATTGLPASRRGARWTGIGAAAARRAACPGRGARTGAGAAAGAGAEGARASASPSSATAGSAAGGVVVASGSGAGAGSGAGGVFGGAVCSVGAGSVVVASVVVVSVVVGATSVAEATSVEASSSASAPATWSPAAAVKAAPSATAPRARPSWLCGVRAAGAAARAGQAARRPPLGGRRARRPGRRRVQPRGPGRATCPTRGRRCRGRRRPGRAGRIGPSGIPFVSCARGAEVGIHSAPHTEPVPTIGACG